MKNLHALDNCRVTTQAVRERYGSYGDARNGIFALKSPTDNGELFVIASTGFSWEHVSVSRRNRCPNWPEMEHVKRTFFEDSETVMQLHVPPAEHVNVHPNCLHLWRPIADCIPRPPEWMVG